MSSTLIYTIDGNQGRILEVYSDRCVIISAGAKSGGAEFRFSEISAVKFRNLSFFMSGYIKFELRETRRGKLCSGENCFIFNAPIGSVHDKLVAQMPAVYDYIVKMASAASGEIIPQEIIE